MQDATYAAVDIIHTCATTNMKDELWTAGERQRMRFGACTYMRSSLNDDTATTCRKLIEQMMGSISVEHADTMIALFDRPRNVDSRFQDTFARLPASFAGPLRFGSMDRPIPRPKSKRASALSTALLLGVEDYAPPSKFENTCAQILAKNGFKLLRSPKRGGEFYASLEGRDLEIECFWSDTPPRGFNRDRLKPAFDQKAVISNWPVPNDLALRYPVGIAMGFIREFIASIRNRLSPALAVPLSDQETRCVPAHLRVR